MCLPNTCDLSKRRSARLDSLSPSSERGVVTSLLSLSSGASSELWPTRSVSPSSSSVIGEYWTLSSPLLVTGDNFTKSTFPADNLASVGWQLDTFASDG